MFETLRRFMFIGLGVAALSKEKTKQLIDEFVERGELTSEEGKKLFEEWISKAEEQGKNLNEKIRNQIRQMLRELDIADRRQIGTLEKKIDELEKRLEELASKLQKSEGSE
ncbi:MAG: phasin family protein [Armatimonadetes bacterium]|nr:phasin family protein [Armatimonadota bacterium]